MDRYYIDYRTGKGVKNLDTTYLAPEQYNELIVDDALAGIYQYKYEDAEGRYLGLSFTREHIGRAGAGGFAELLDAHCKRYDFTPERIVRKTMFVTHQQFKELFPDDTYQGGL